MTKRRSQKRRPLISALEPRILFDGAAIATAVDVLDNTSFDSTIDSTDTNDATKQTADVPVTAQQSDRREIAFVDTSVEDYKTLVDGIGENVEVYEISSTDEIEAILQNLSDIDAIHILSHGNTGEITIGDEVINSDTLSQFSDTLDSIKNSLSQDGDIMLYGCNVASNGEGQDFIDEIASLTSADVAASDDITGSSNLGGDWVLEAESGVIETEEIVVGNYIITLDTDANQTFEFGGGSGSAGSSLTLTAELAGSGTGTLSISAYDVDYSSGERNAVYFKDANDSSETLLGYLQGSNNANYTTTFSNVSFNTSGTATIRIYGEATGWSYTVNSATFVTTGNIAPYFTSSASASLNEDGSVNITVAGRDGGTLNDNVTLSLYTSPSHGTISGFATQSGSTTASDTFTYTPNSDYYGSDTIKFKLTDGIDTVYQTINITVNAVNDAPVLTGDLSATVLEGGIYTLTTSDLYYTDVDDTSTGVTFTVNNLTNGTLKVNGTTASTFTVAQLSSGLVSFVHDGSETTVASFSVKVEDGNEDSSTPTSNTFNFTVTPVDDAPVLTIGTLGTHDGTTASSSIIAPNLTVTDAEGDSITQAKIQINNFVSGDTLTFTKDNATMGSITAFYDSVAGVMTLSGTGTTGEYQSALRAITFSKTSSDTTDRSFSFTIGSAIPFEDNGHYYEVVYVPGGITWTDAVNAAAAKTLYGMQGYLATITSAAENAFLYDKLNSATQGGDLNAWIGGSDSAVEGTWKWVTGPEAGTTFSIGNYPSTVTEVTYENWNGGEPNDSGSNEDAAEFYGGNNGYWNDLPTTGTGSNVTYYIVEYGGMSGDSTPVISGTATMVVNDAPVAINDTVNATEDATVTGNIVTNDTDTENNTLTVVAIRTGTEAGTGTSGTVGQALVGTYGTLTLNSNGSYSYVADQNAADTIALGATTTEYFTYTVSDGSLSDKGQITVTITGTNDAPIIDLNSDSSTLNSTITFTEVEGIDDHSNAVSSSLSSMLNISDIDNSTLKALTIGGSTSTFGVYAGDELLVNGITLDLTTTKSGTTAISGVTFNYSVTSDGAQTTVSFTTATAQSITAYEALLDSMKFNNSSDTPNITSRNLYVSVTDANNGISEKAQITINVTPTNDIPEFKIDYSDDFNDTSWDGWIGATNSTSQTMTGDMLQLTSTSSSQFGGALFDTAFDSSDLTTIEFTYYSAGGTGADGISFFLVDGTTTEFTLGASGGDLGYSGTSGLSGGWLGLGLDEYGNFASSKGIYLKGSEAYGYPVITGSSEAAMGNNSIDGGYRGVRITLDGSTNTFKVEWDPNNDGIYEYTPINIDLDTYIAQNKISATPDTFKFGFAASTGGSTNIHAIDSFSMTSTGTVSPTLDYLENSGAVQINGSSIGLTDLDDTNLESATITISTGYNVTEDILSFVNQNGITGSWDGLNGKLTLTGTATVAQYIEALKAVKYENTSENPDTTQRVVTYSVNDGDDDSSNQLTAKINILSVNDAPTLTNTDTTPTFVEASNKTTITSTPVNIVSTSDFAIADLESDNIQTVKIKVENVSDSGKEYLNIDGTKINITASSSGTTTNGFSYSVSVSGTTSTLTLTVAPSQPLANANGFIKSITYQNDSDKPTTSSNRVVYVSVVDDAGILNGGNNTLAFEKVSEISITSSDDNPVALAMAANVTTNSFQTFKEFSPNFTDADGVYWPGTPFHDATGDAPYILEILSLPTIDTFEYFDGTAWRTVLKNASNEYYYNDGNNDILLNSGDSDYEGRFVVNINTEMEIYRFNSGSNSGVVSQVDWRIMTYGDTDDATGWSNTATGNVTIINPALNKAPDILSFKDSDGNTISDGGTFIIPENVTDGASDNTLNNLTMIIADDYTPEAFLNIQISSSDTTIIDPADIVRVITTTNIDDVVKNGDGSLAVDGNGLVTGDDGTETDTDNTVTFNLNPKSNQSGTVTLTFTISDGSKTTTYTIDVDVNENPVIYNPGSVLNVPDAASYVSIANDAELQVTDQTVSMWIKPDGTSTTWQPLIMKVDATGSIYTRNFSLWIVPNTLNIHYAITINGVNQTVNTGVQLTQDEWNFVTATYDGSTMKIYVDGDLSASKSVSGTVYTGSENFYIGGLPNGLTNGYKAFTGDIAEVSLYNTALSEAQIEATMRTQLTGTEDNLVYYTRFTTDADGYVVDLTSTNNTGILTGNATVTKQVDIDKNSEYADFTATDFSTNFLYTDAESDAFDGIKLTSLPANGTLTLSGSAVSVGDILSIADIANLVYTPDTDYYGTDSFGYQAMDDIGGFSNTALFDITINYIDTDPKIMGTTTLSVNEDSGATTISGFTVTDYYAVTPGFTAHELVVKVVATHGALAVGTAGSTTVTGTGTKTLTITGTASQIQGAINTLTYTPDAEYSGSDDLDISIMDKTLNPSTENWKPYYASEIGMFYNPTNGHYYEYVSAPGITWADAKVAAENSTLYGLQGYLATVTSQEEQNLIQTMLGGQGWMGASDANTTWTNSDGIEFTTSEGYWTWVTGPEAGTLFWMDNTNNTDTATETTQGVAVNDEYNNWNSGETNDWGGNEDFAHFLSSGKWNDYREGNTSIQGYVVEYGGFNDDPAIQSATLSITVNGVNDAPTISVTGIENSPNVEYIENDDPITLLSNVTLSDADNTTLKNAIVSISTGFTAGDLLSFTNDGSTMGNITASYNASTGVLTLTSSDSSATLAQWENALESVQFSSTSFNPGISKTISWSVDDGQAVDHASNIATTTIDIKEVYSEQETNYLPIGSSIDLSSFNVGTDNFGGKYIEFDVSGRTTTEDLGFTTSANTTGMINGEIRIVGNAVYLKDSDTVKLIGQIDGTYNGEDGKALRINFAVDFENGDFQTGSNGDITITGWEVVNTQVNLGVTYIGGFLTPEDTSYPYNNLHDTNNYNSGNPIYDDVVKRVDSYVYNPTTYLSTSYQTNSDLAIRMDTSDIYITEGYGVLRGPYVISTSSVSLAVGDSVSFDWKALSGGDAYDAYGYLLNVSDGSIVQLLNATGSSANTSTSWATATTTIGEGQAGEYKFVFIAGSYDATGGRKVGGELMIDDVKVTQANPSSNITSNVLESIAQKLTYTDSSNLTYENDLGTRAITISAKDTGNSTYSTTSSFDKIEINDPISLSSVNAINYFDTDGVDNFSDVSGTLTSSDADSGTTAIYGIDGGSISGTTITKVGSYGTLTLDSSTGAYTYEPNDSVIDALSSSTSETFTVTVTDNNPNGISSTDSKTLTINITAVNDSPLLGGSSNSVTFTENGSAVLIDSTITIDDTEGENYSGGYLYIKNSANGESEDQLTILQTGGITLDGSNVKYAGTVIGTIDSTYNGVDGKDLKITFNSDAYSTQVQALARAIAFSNATNDISSSARTYQIQVNDGGSPTPRFSTKEITVNIDAINDLPVISLDSTTYEVEKVISTNSNGTLNLSGISFSDLDDTTLTVKFETTNYGQLSVNNATGLTVSGNGTRVVTVLGTIANINAMLSTTDGLVYVADGITTGNDIVTPGLDKLKITAIDANSGQVISQKEVTVLPAVPNAFSTNIVEIEDALVSVDLESLVNDVNGTSRVFTVGFGTADVTDLNGDITTNGAFTSYATEIRDSNNKLIGYQLAHGTLTIAEGTLDDANFVAQFVYTPDSSNWNGTETFIYQYDSADVANPSNIAQVTIVVTAANDAPVITLTNGTSETIDEDTTLTFTGAKAITLADADNTGSETFDLTLSVSNGELDLSTTSGLTFLSGTNSSGIMTIRGTLSALQTAINGLTYTPNADWYGNDNLEITFNDRGNIGSGNVLEDFKTIAITVNSVNDTPIIDSAIDINITDGSGINIIEDTITNYMKVSDPDTSSLTYKIDNGSSLVGSLIGTYGTLTINASTGEYVFTPNQSAIAALTENATENFTLDVYDGTTHVQKTINVNITAASSTPATYTEQDPATLVLADTSIETTASYGGGFIEFEVSSPEATEILSLQKVSTADITDGAISIVGSTVYLGDGTTAKAIGQIDGTYNGEDGEKLRINFAVDFNNGSFNSTSVSSGLLSSTSGAVINIDGWTIINDRVEFGEDTIAGLATPVDSIWPSKTYKTDSTNYQDDSGDLESYTFKTYINEDSSGDNSIQMYSTMWSVDGYAVIRGPYIYSESAVSLEAGDTVQFDWKAEGGGDAYDVFGYIIDVNDETNYQVILNETGANASAQTLWATESITVDTAGEYKFVFVSGTWDASGGRKLGAQLYIDDVMVIQANPPSGIESDVLEKIAQLVTYENTGDLTANNDVQNKTITVTTSSGDATPIVHSDTKALNIQEVNDNPTLVQPTTIYYTDTVATDDFSDESGTLVANDVDSGTSFTYGIEGGTISGTTITKVGTYGTLTLNTSTGAYTFSANDNAINALGESIIETFAVTVNDGDGGVATKNIIVDITAVNDGPILGGAKPGDTLSDTYGAYTPISYTENSAPVVIDPTITVTDPETKSYEDGQLKVSVTTNANSGDQLSLVTTGGISVDGTNVLYGSAIIGTIDSTYDGVNGEDLIINLTDKAYSTEVQALMRAISYNSTNDAFTNLSRTITMEINDGGNGGTTTAAMSSKDAIVNITPINDIPVIDSGSSAFEMEKVLGSTTIGSSEDGSMYLTGISFSDVDETTDVTVVLSTTDTTPQTDTISVNSGTVSVGETFTWGDGTNSVTVTAVSGDDIYTIADKLVVAINNDATLSQDYTAAVSGKMDGKFTVTSDSLEVFTSAVSETSSGATISSETTQKVYGLLTVKTGVTNGVTNITGNGTKEVTLTGTISEINTTLAELDGLTYVAGDGNDTVTPGINSLNILITDSQGAEVTYSKEVVVLPAVPNSFSSNVILTEDTSITYDIGSLIADINDNSGTYVFGTVGTVGETHINENQVDTISLPSSPSGTYTWTDGSGTIASGTSVATLISDINSKFNGKYLAAVDSDPSVFTVTTVNSADEFTSVVTGTDISKLATLAKGAVVIDNIGSITPFTTLDIITAKLDLNGDGDTNDANESDRQVGYQLDNGTLILENDQVLGGDFAKFTFTPNSNWNGTEVIYYKYISGDGTISPVSKVLFYTSAVNDAPTITSNETQEVNEDTSISFDTANSNRIVINDLDVTSEELELTLDVTNGKLTLGSTSNLTFLEGTNNSAHIVIKGSLSDLQAALDGMSYLANENYYGSDALEIVLNDLGNVGTLGNVLVDTKTIDITVTNVNDTPVLEVLNADITDNTLSESTISQSGLVKFSDIDKEDLPTLSQDLTAIEYLAQDGTTPLTLTTTQLSDIENAFSLSIASGNTNSGSATWSFDIAETKLDFLANGEVVTAVFTITVTDDTGATDTQDVTIKITGTNDTPYFGDGSESSSENTSSNPALPVVKEIFSNADFEDGLTGWTSNDAVIVTGTDTITFPASPYYKMTPQVKAILDSTGGNSMTWVIDGSDDKMVKLEAKGSGSEFNLTFQTVSGISNDSMTYIKDTFYSTSSKMPTNVAYITKTFDAIAGDTYEIAWNYVSGDYVPWNDGSVLTFVNNNDASNTAVLDGIQAEVALLGATNEGTSNYTTQSYGSTGWQTSTIQVLESGSYTLTLAVFNLGDTALNPYLLIDNIAGTTTLNGETFAPLPKDANAPTPAGDEVTVTTGLVETNSTLTDSDTVQLTDLDITDSVNISSIVVSAVQYDIDGTVMSSDSLEPTNQELLNMFSVTPNTPAIDITEITKELTWNFNSNSEAFDYLGEGEKLVLTYTMTATDSETTSDTQDITIIINGTNDAPTITIVKASGSISEGNQLNDFGSITFVDLDTTDRPTSSFVTKSITSSDVSLTNSQKAALSSAFSISDGTNTNNGTVNWDYTITDDKINFLNAGETITAVFTISVTDDEGSIATQDITVTITGSNSAPVLEPLKTIYYTDTDGNDTFTNTLGQAVATDLDSNAVLTFGMDGEVTTTETTVSKTLTYGEITINKSTGEYTFVPNTNAINQLSANTSETVTITVTDDNGAISSQVLTIDIQSVNDAPLLMGTSTNVTFTENGSAVSIYPNLIIDDLEGTSYNTGSLTFSTTANGEIEDNFIIREIGGITVSGNEVSYAGVVIGTINSSYDGINGEDLRVDLNENAFSGQVQALARAISFLNETDDLSDLSREIEITVNDGGNGGETTARFSQITTSVAITTINDLPEITLFSGNYEVEKVIGVNDDGTLQLNSISFADKDDTSLTITLETTQYGILTLNDTTGLNVSGNGSRVVTIEGTISQINSVLANSTALTYVAGSGNDIVTPGLDFLKVTAVDALSGESIATKAVMVLPAVPNADSDNVVGYEDETTIVDLEALIHDINDNAGNYVLGTGTPSIDGVVNSGLITPFSGNEIENANGDVIGYTLSSGTLILNDGIMGTDNGTFTFTPNENYNGMETFVYKYYSNDGKESLVGQIAIFTVPVNDAPTLDVPSAQSINEDTPLVFENANAITIDDLDVASGDMQLTLSVSNGTIALSTDANLTYAQGSNNSSILTVRGTLSDLQNAINGLTYQGNQDFYGNDTLSVTINDLGNSGNGTPLSETKTIAITVNPVNDTPNFVDETAEISGSIKADYMPLSQKGTIAFVDVDVTNTPEVTYATKSITWRGQTNNILELSTSQYNDFNDAFTISTNPNNTNVGNVSWDYEITDDKLDFLAEGETVTVIYTLTVTDESGTTDAKDVTITITGTNDGPTLDVNSDLYFQIGFGESLEPINLKEQFNFGDLDTTDKFTFTVYNVPPGFIVDPDTGVLSGAPTQSGPFTITVRGTDKEGAYIEKSFDMLVIAPPPPPEAPADEAPKDEPADEGDTGTNPNNTGNQEGEGGNGDDGLDITRTELTTIAREGNGNDQGTVISAGFTVDVLNNGQVQFNDESNQAFETVGLVVERMEIIQDQIEVEVIDTRAGQKYVVTQADGTDLPDSLSFDPNTGIIRGTLPAGMEELEISIKALSDDGTTRILNIKIDLNELRKKAIESSKEASYETLKDQIVAQNYKMTGYGDYVARLFS